MFTKVLYRLVQSSAVAAGVVGGMQNALAQPIIKDQPPSPKFADLPTALDTVFDLVFSIAGAIFVILLIVGGIQYLTAAGNEENTTKARRLLVDAIVGLIIVLAAFAIGKFILHSFGLTGIIG